MSNWNRSVSSFPWDEGRTLRPESKVLSVEGNLKRNIGFHGCHKSNHGIGVVGDGVVGQSS
jgi:hypothetical protein